TDALTPPTGTRNPTTLPRCSRCPRRAEEPGDDDVAAGTDARGGQATTRRPARPDKGRAGRPPTRIKGQASLPAPAACVLPRPPASSRDRAAIITEDCFNTEYCHAIRVVILRDKNILRAIAARGA